ncbi:iron-sulfur cluster biosynthesis family protein [Mesobacillus maritimus]|jgi:uncharacterized protein YqkB|uniref:Iron-sulfur cluster biosynthesis family protein n=1 Tax=Mesobacillus maritimus TaxID=1643336 RepID=A0ABS7K2H1_9BACI|nr:iron-sulfur cluster biosynthesis family protein [Mesobacillus maritimus]MBY0096469.1 iron-sulfur cluster biosynthesis family protein [Mesobacillus maritimus]
MEIIITETAEKKLTERTAGKQGVLKIEYDTENCCSVNGTAMLWFIDQPSDLDQEVQTNGLPVYIEKAKTIFFDEEMKIDYVESRGCFQLKSANQYFNPSMGLIDKTIKA